MTNEQTVPDKSSVFVSFISTGSTIIPAGPNNAPVDKNNQVIKPASVVNTGDEPAVGGPQFPSLSRGDLTNTTLDKMNNSLSHVCDFSLEVQKNNALRKFLVAQAQTIRDAIRKITEALGLSDSTGQYQWLFTKLKSITRDLQYIQTEVIKPIMDFEKQVVQYIAKIQAIIAWILTLPVRLLAMLQDCLKKMYKLLANLFTAVAADLAADAGSGTGEIGFSDVVAAAKETISTTLQTVNQAAQVAVGAMAIQGAAMSTIQSASAIPDMVSGLKKGI